MTCMKLKIIGKTDAGLERANNEDAYAFCTDLNAQLWNVDGKEFSPGAFGSLAIVADGMGGANSGEMASSVAINAIRRCFGTKYLQKVVPGDSSQIEDFLKGVIKEAGAAILNYIDNNPDSVGMGTTVVILWIIGDKAVVLWCGDSRCYVYNHSTGLKALTKDHSYVQELIDAGKITLEDSLSHPDSSIITRCLGDCESSSEPEIRVYDVHEDDNFILCTDGLCGYCTDDSIEHVLDKTSEKKTCSELVKLALSAGGYDNVTVIHVSVSEERKTGGFFRKLF